MNTHLCFHLLFSHPSKTCAWVFHVGWKLQQLRLGCSHTSPLDQPEDEDVPGPHPGSRDHSNRVAECQLRASSPSFPAARRMKAQPARAGATGSEPTGSTRMDPGPTAGSSSTRLCLPVQTGTERLRGAGVVLAEAQPASQPAALVSPSGLSSVGTSSLATERPCRAPL